MIMLFPRPWRHRLIAAHAAAGAGVLGAGAALLASSSKDLAVDAAIPVLAAHLALLAAVVGLVAFRRNWRHSSSKVAKAGTDPAPRRRTETEL